MRATEKNGPAEVTEAVFIPKMNKHDDAQYVAVNGERILVRKGEAVTLPARFAEVLRHSEQAAARAERFIESVSARMSPPRQPPARGTKTAAFQRKTAGWKMWRATAPSSMR